MSFLKSDYTLKPTEVIITDLKPCIEDNTAKNEEKYLYLKAKMMQAKCLSKIRDYGKSDEIIEEICEIVKKED